MPRIGDTYNKKTTYTIKPCRGETIVKVKTNIYKKSLVEATQY